MRDEISAAVLFLVRLIEKSANFNQEQLQDFKNRLCELLAERFENHWFPEKPDKGQGYRCIRVNGVNRRDATIEKAAVACGIKYEDMKLPFELTIWVDPNEVCCRFGESKGSFCTLASFCDKESLDSSSGSEESSEDSLKGNSPSPLSTPTKQSLQISVREKPRGSNTTLFRLKTARDDKIKTGNVGNRGRRGYYQYHNHHNHQHSQPWYNLSTPPWMGPHHINNNINNSNNNSHNNNVTPLTTNSNNNNSSTTLTTAHNGINSSSIPTTPLQYHNHHANNNNNSLRTRWQLSSTGAANHHHHHHNRYDSSTSQKSALKV